MQTLLNDWMNRNEWYLPVNKETCFPYCTEVIDQGILAVALGSSSTSAGYAFHPQNGEGT